MYLNLIIKLNIQSSELVKKNHSNAFCRLDSVMASTFYSTNRSVKCASHDIILIFCKERENGK